MFRNLLSQVVWGLLNRGFLWCRNSPAIKAFTLVHVVLTKSCVTGNATVHEIHAHQTQQCANIKTAFAQLTVS